MPERRRLTLLESVFTLLVLWGAWVIHGPAGTALASALVPGGNLFLALLAGLVWLASGAVLLAAVLSIVWLVRWLWTRRRR